MADQDGRPLLRLPAPRSFLRKKRQLKTPLPKVSPSSHGGHLGRGAASVRQHHREAEERFPELATDVPYVRIEPAAGTLLTDDDLRSIGLIPIYRREDAVFAAYAPDDLSQFQQKLGRYEREEKYKVFSKISSVAPWAREDRMSQRLRAGLGELDPEQMYLVDVLMLPIETASAMPGALRRINAFLERRAARILDRVERAAFTAFRARANGQALSDLLEYRDDIALVDLPPKAHVLVQQVCSLNLDDMPEVSGPPDDAPAICVVDSGVLEGHPLLEPAVLAEVSRSFPEDVGPPVPAPPIEGARHGTRVAGIALYGDVGACAMAKAFNPEFWLCNARILDDNAELPESRMPLVAEIVEHVQSRLRDRCRVFNLSVGLDPHEGYLSVPAGELDDLANTRDVLFVVSSGNLAAGQLAGAEYPGCVENPEMRVRSPADALNVLTVGSIAPDREVFPQRGRAVAPKLGLSPFSCSGGLKGVVKPELVEIGGNLVHDEASHRWVANPGISVPTTDASAEAGRLLTLAHGTSFATPRVAHLAARIFERFPTASVNLVRALLVHSASSPPGLGSRAPQASMKLCGFGVPDIDRAMFSRPPRATLYHEGEIEVDEVQLFELPVPDAVMAARGKKQLVVTLAYNPPVSVARRDRPAGIHLRWEVARGDVPETVVREKIVSEDEEKDEATWKTKGGKPKAVFLTWSLPRRLQAQGTVRKSAFQWTHRFDGTHFNLAVIAKATRPAYLGKKQRFAVVVSIECGDAQVDVHQAIRTRLGAGRVRVRVRTS